MIELPEYVWQDITDEIGDNVVPHFVDYPTAWSRNRFRCAIDRIVEIVDMERARQIRRTMQPSPDKEAPNA